MAKRGPKPLTLQSIYKPDGRTIGEIAMAVCRRIGEDGLTMADACAQECVPVTTVMKWADQIEEISEEYARARDRLLDVRINELLRIANEVVAPDEVAAAKLKIDTMRWALSKIAPRNFGDRVSSKIEHSGPSGEPLPVVQFQVLAIAPPDGA